MSSLNFIESTRRDLTTLCQADSGRDLCNAIGGAKDKWVGIQDAGSAPGIRQRNNKKYPEKARDGTGDNALVSHHPNIGQRWGEVQAGDSKSAKVLEKVGVDAATALGHELLHAYGSVAGCQKHSTKNEERRVIGKPDGSRGKHGLPTENSILRDLSEQVYAGGGVVKKIMPRRRYGGELVQSRLSRWADSVAKLLRKFS